jgi:predicted NACHT family NTPase
MAAFEDKQIEQFIKNWFQKSRDLEVDTAKRCWQLLNSNDYRAAKELAQTPLLLTLLCVVYDEFQDFPKKRHALYGEALDVLLRKWASEKRIQRNPIYQELSAELELDMLAEIAYTSFADDQLFFAKDRLVQQIREFLVENLNAPNHLDAETVLREIEVQQGILVERARDAYSFSHLTFQEYLTAKCIVDNQKIDRLVHDHVTEQHWREVFLLVAGLAPGKRGADDLLVAMEEQAQTYLASDKLKTIIAWATQVTDNSPGEARAPAKRVAAIFLALALALAFDRALALARDRDRDLALALALALALDPALAFDRALDLYLDCALALALALDYRRFGIFSIHSIDSIIIDLTRLKNGSSGSMVETVLADTFPFSRIR